MKGVIIAAGYGTRFLPVTKVVPKELLPLVTVPSIDFIVKEFERSGIRDIIIVSSRRKKALEDYFDREVELESVFERESKSDRLASIAPSSRLRFAFVRQQHMLGTGHALLQVKPLLGGEPCVVAYPDDLHIGEPPLAAQLIDSWEETGCSVLASLHEDGDVSRYGVLDLAEDRVHVKAIVEKPPRGTEPSREVSIGRYLYTPEFFDYLEEGWEIHSRERPGSEYFHVYALNKIMAQGRVVYRPMMGTRLDTGSPQGYLEATLRYADADESLRPVLERYFAARRAGGDA